MIRHNRPKYEIQSTTHSNTSSVLSILQIRLNRFFSEIKNLQLTNSIKICHPLIHDMSGISIEPGKCECPNNLGAFVQNRHSADCKRKRTRWENIRIYTKKVGQTWQSRTDERREDEKEAKAKATVFIAFITRAPRIRYTYRPNKPTPWFGNGEEKWRN